MDGKHIQLTTNWKANFLIKKKVIHPKKNKQSINFLIMPLSMLSSKLCQQRASVLFCYIVSPKSTRSLVTIAGVLVVLIKNDAEGTQTTEANTHSVEVVWNPSRFWITEHVAQIPEKSSHWENTGPNASKWRGCCLQQIKYRLFLAACSYRRSQFLWHGVFRQSLCLSASFCY